MHVNCLLHRVCVLQGQGERMCQWTLRGIAAESESQVFPGRSFVSGRGAGSLAPLRLTGYGRGGPLRG